jgi:hypothetical protein
VGDAPDQIVTRFVHLQGEDEPAANASSFVETPDHPVEVALNQLEYKEHQRER